jgi:hypothetical protein
VWGVSTSSFYRWGGQPPKGHAPAMVVPPPLPSFMWVDTPLTKQRVTIIPLIFHSKSQRFFSHWNTFNSVYLMFVIQWTLHSMNTSFNEQTLTLSPFAIFWYTKTIPVLYQNSPCAVQIFLRCSISTQNASTNLKCVTLRFVNNVDMIETLLRSIIISGIWRSVMTPTHSTMN